MSRGSLTLDGLRAKLRKLGVDLTDCDPARRTWVLTPRQGPPIIIGNPTDMSAEERFELFEIVRNRVDPFGSMH